MSVFFKSLRSRVGYRRRYFLNFMQNIWIALAFHRQKTELKKWENSVFKATKHDTYNIHVCVEIPICTHTYVCIYLLIFVHFACVRLYVYFLATEWQKLLLASVVELQANFKRKLVQLWSIFKENEYWNVTVFPRIPLPTHLNHHYGYYPQGKDEQYGNTRVNDPLKNPVP